MTAPKKGDRVRVVLEGRVSQTFNEGVVEGEHFGFLDDDDQAVGPWLFPLRDNFTVEVLEPPVVQFGPGDFVREKNTKEPWTYLLLEGGWVVVDRPSGPTRKPIEGTHGHFTSDLFEKVDLAVVPF